MSRKLISSDEAVPATCQHTTPCSDCPWSREALKGWLGGTSADDWVAAAHSDQVIDCHTLQGAQCAGAAIYRANVCKAPRGDAIRLPRNTEKVFSTPMEFKAHHSFTREAENA